MRELDFEPIKSTEHFLSNYGKHDLADSLFSFLVGIEGFNLADFGDDQRTERIWESGEDKPDKLISLGAKHLALIDIKGHIDITWMVNLRAYESYIRWGQILQLPVYVVWLSLNRLQIALNGITISLKPFWYTQLPFINPKQKRMPHDSNWIVETNNVKPLGQLWLELKK